MAISVTVARGGSRAARTVVDSQQWVEATIALGGGAARSAKIGSTIGSAAVIVDSWSPEDGADDAAHLQSYRVNCHAHPDSNEFEKLYDGGGTFGAGGTLTQTVEVGSGIQLDTNAPNMTFEDYVLDVTIADSGNPDTWIWLGGDGSNPWVTRDNAFNWDGQHIEMTPPGFSWFGATDAKYWEATYSLDCYLDGTYGAGYGSFYICHQLRGSGTALRGYACILGAGQYASLVRINSATNTYGVGSTTIGVVAEDVLWHAKVKFTNNGTTTWCYVKRWLDTESEPVDFLYVGGDTAYAAIDGWAGIGAKSGGGAYKLVADNYKIEPDPSVYYEDGDWTSDEIDTTPIEVYSHALIEWDETSPIDTAVLVKARWKTGGTWLACTNGGQVPGIDLGDSTTAGSSKDSLEIKVELETSDTDITPLVENLLVFHEPLAPSALEVEINGTISCTIASETLNVWGIKQVIGGVNDEAWDDVWAETYQPHHLLGRLRSVVAKLIYNGIDIDEIITTTTWDYFRTGPIDVIAEFSMNPIKYASAPVEARWNVIHKWAPIGHVYEWILIDRSMGMRADAWYIVGHEQLDDHPAQFITGSIEITDHLGSLITEGYQLDDTPASCLIQGWQLDDHVAGFMPAIETIADHIGMAVVAVRETSDHPGSFVVYGVNRDAHIEVTIIDEATWAELIARGFTRG